MNCTGTKLTFGRRAWYVPSEGRAFVEWLEGRPSEAQRETVIALAQQRHVAWKPGPQAWDQLVQLQSFVGKRVSVQFWEDNSMWMLDEGEWPSPVEAHCEGVVTMIDAGHLQAFLLLRDPVNVRSDQPSQSSYLRQRSAINCTLAPLAHLLEVEALE